MIILKWNFWLFPGWAVNMPLLLPICSKSADWTFVDHKKDFDMTEKANSPRAPLKSGLPHVGYVLYGTRFTQPFIFREVEGLQNELPLEVYTLYGKNLRCCSDEMKRSAENARNYGIKAPPPICFEIGRQICSHPRRFWKLLRRSLFRHWKSFETFGENLWAFCAGLRPDDSLLMTGLTWPMPLAARDSHSCMDCFGNSRHSFCNIGERR